MAVQYTSASVDKSSSLPVAQVRHLSYGELANLAARLDPLLNRIIIPLPFVQSFMSLAW